jgi:hypothetical protein
MAAMVLSLSACDNTKLQLRAPEPESNSTALAVETSKSDTLVSDTIKKHPVSLH